MPDYPSLIVFLEKLNHAPLCTDEVAHAASQIKDSPKLAKAAKKWLQADEEFSEALEEVGFEFG